MRWVYIRVHKYKTHVHRRGEVGSQSETKLQGLRERQINTPSERKKEKERLTKKDVKKGRQNKYCQGLTSPALIWSGFPSSNCALITSKTDSANNADMSLSNELHLEFNDGSVHA